MAPCGRVSVNAADHVVLPAQPDGTTSQSDLIMEFANFVEWTFNALASTDADVQANPMVQCNTSLQDVDRRVPTDIVRHDDIVARADDEVCISELREKMVAVAEARLQNLTTKVRELEAQLRDMQRVETEKQTLEVQTRSLRKEKAEVLERAQRVVTQKSVLEEQLRSLREEKAELFKGAQRAETQKQSLEEELRSLREQYAELFKENLHKQQMYQENMMKFRHLAMIGKKVRLTGLKAKPELNEQEGTLVCFDEVKGRWQTKLTNGQMLEVKPDNLELKNGGLRSSLYPCSMPKSFFDRDISG